MHFRADIDRTESLRGLSVCWCRLAAAAVVYSLCGWETVDVLRLCGWHLGSMKGAIDECTECAAGGGMERMMRTVLLVCWMIFWMLKLWFGI